MLLTALLATVVAVVDLELWKMDADVPLLGADGDAGYYLATVKNVVEHGCFWHNADLGAPFGQDSYDFAAPFGMTYVLIPGLGITADEMPGGHLVALVHPVALCDRLEAYRAEVRSTAAAAAT